MDGSSPSSDFFCSPTAQFLIWTFIVTLVLGLLAYIFKATKIRRPLTRAAMVFGPLLPVLFSIYGMVFFAPGSARKVCRFGFFQYWFHRRDTSHYEVYPGVLTVLVVLIIILFLAGIAMAVLRSRQSRRLLPALCAFESWYISAHFFYRGIWLVRDGTMH